MTESAVCPDCGQTIVVDNGILRQHAGAGDWAGVTCPSSGIMIYQPVPQPVGEPIESTEPPLQSEEPPPRV